MSVISVPMLTDLCSPAFLFSHRAFQGSVRHYALGGSSEGVGHGHVGWRAWLLSVVRGILGGAAQGFWSLCSGNWGSTSLVTASAGRAVECPCTPLSSARSPHSAAGMRRHSGITSSTAWLSTWRTRSIPWSCQLAWMDWSTSLFESTTGSLSVPGTEEGGFPASASRAPSR